MLVHRSRERSERWRRWIIAGIALTAGTVLSARQSATFRKATEIVPVHVTVRTNGGEIVRGLTAKDFEVFDNGSRREILTFSSDPLPVSVAILLDRSGSLDMYAHQVARAGDAFLDHLLPGDRVSVQTLATDCQPLTTDFSLVRRAAAPCRQRRRRSAAVHGSRCRRAQRAWTVGLPQRQPHCCASTQARQSCRNVVASVESDVSSASSEPTVSRRRTASVPKC